eukprot:TRINITY_DN8996_c0_g1_i2.p1 TRINITY_DN8996_c0_g1~~TRINITY_DN8996_c0_g1_i2.p1  ORF type:complete len:1525 (-),score=253.10 TRINITY_DN8996_c0_g1_i2:72-4646(-)
MADDGVWLLPTTKRKAEKRQATPPMSREVDAAPEVVPNQQPLGRPPLPSEPPGRRSAVLSSSEDEAWSPRGQNGDGDTTGRRRGSFGMSLSSSTTSTGGGLARRVRELEKLLEEKENKLKEMKWRGNIDGGTSRAHLRSLLEEERNRQLDKKRRGKAPVMVEQGCQFGSGFAEHIAAVAQTEGAIHDMLTQRRTRPPPIPKTYMAQVIVNLTLLRLRAFEVLDIPLEEAEDIQAMQHVEQLTQLCDHDDLAVRQAWDDKVPGTMDPKQVQLFRFEVDACFRQFFEELQLRFESSRRERASLLAESAVARERRHKEENASVYQRVIALMRERDAAETRATALETEIHTLRGQLRVREDQFASTLGSLLKERSVFKEQIYRLNKDKYWLAESVDLVDALKLLGQEDSLPDQQNPDSPQKSGSFDDVRQRLMSWQASAKKKDKQKDDLVLRIFKELEAKKAIIDELLKRNRELENHLNGVTSALNATEEERQEMARKLAPAAQQQQALLQQLQRQSSSPPRTASGRSLASNTEVSSPLPRVTTDLGSGAATTMMAFQFPNSRPMSAISEALSGHSSTSDFDRPQKPKHKQLLDASPHSPPRAEPGQLTVPKTATNHTMPIYVPPPAAMQQQVPAAGITSGDKTKSVEITDKTVSPGSEAKLKRKKSSRRSRKDTAKVEGRVRTESRESRGSKSSKSSRSSRSSSRGKSSESSKQSSDSKETPVAPQTEKKPVRRKTAVQTKVPGKTTSKDRKAANTFTPWEAESFNFDDDYETLEPADSHLLFPPPPLTQAQAQNHSFAELPFASNVVATKDLVTQLQANLSKIKQGLRENEGRQIVSHPSKRSTTGQGDYQIVGNRVTEDKQFRTPAHLTEKFDETLRLVNSLFERVKQLEIGAAQQQNRANARNKPGPTPAAGGRKVAPKQSNPTAKRAVPADTKKTVTPLTLAEDEIAEISERARIQAAASRSAVNALRMQLEDIRAQWRQRSAKATEWENMYLELSKAHEAMLEELASLRGDYAEALRDYATAQNKDLENTDPGRVTSADLKRRLDAIKLQQIKAAAPGTRVVVRDPVQEGTTAPEGMFDLPPPPPLDDTTADPHVPTLAEGTAPLRLRGVNKGTQTATTSAVGDARSAAAIIGTDVLHYTSPFVKEHEEFESGHTNLIAGCNALTQTVFRGFDALHSSLHKVVLMEANFDEVFPHPSKPEAEKEEDYPTRRWQQLASLSLSKMAIYSEYERIITSVLYRIKATKTELEKRQRASPVKEKRLDPLTGILTNPPSLVGELAILGQGKRDVAVTVPVSPPSVGESPPLKTASRQTARAEPHPSHTPQHFKETAQKLSPFDSRPTTAHSLASIAPWDGALDVSSVSLELVCSKPPSTAKGQRKVAAPKPSSSPPQQSTSKPLLGKATALVEIDESKEEPSTAAAQSKKPRPLKDVGAVFRAPPLKKRGAVVGSYVYEESADPKQQKETDNTVELRSIPNFGNLLEMESHLEGLRRTLHGAATALSKERGRPVKKAEIDHKLPRIAS